MGRYTPAHRRAPVHRDVWRRRQPGTVSRTVAAAAVPVVLVGVIGSGLWHGSSHPAAPTSVERPAMSAPTGTVPTRDAAPTTTAPTWSAPVGLARTPSGTGYWTVTAAGHVKAHGDARDYGSLSDRDRDHAISGMASTPDGKGYWLVATNGSVFAFGDATWHGSLRGQTLHAPVVGISSTSDGKGYFLASANGAVHTFGDAAWHGSLRDHHIDAPVVGMAATGSGHGYWLATASGRVFGFGDAGFRGSLHTIHTYADVMAITPSPHGDGYWLTGRDGAVYAFGDAYYAGESSPTTMGDAVSLLVHRERLAEHRRAAVVHRPAPSRTVHATPVHATPVTTTTTAATNAGGQSLGPFTVTCYDNYGTTASGATTSLETVAVDPAVIPLGTTIDISGVGVRVAQDTGGAIVGNRLDIWEPSESACVDWGVRSEDVWLGS